ncbi:amidohydrolase family protein [Microbacterium sp. SORGH_AS_0888]|uniref:amidohydrolase family protein n=1 Tax=Microbacterium sp. SORGH_AS_0888 TaxID=3041791 RepID=UPI002786F7CC|nr:amidohydrolase family protein [Microbacterium sp. SORGH_AS_0888]MDQ1128937.1 cytosine deaminase [Microbacterium sp. SORGH_AS_0888]
MDAELLEPGQRIGRITGLAATGDVADTLTFAEGRVVDATSFPHPMGETVDASGWVALPPLADLHAHLDKGYTWSAFGQPEGSLDDAITCWMDHGASHSFADIKAGARRHLLAALHSGVTAVRSHANYHLGDDPLRGVRALVELREEFAGLVDLQIVASPGPSDGPDDLGRAAVMLGIDLVGGFPHLAEDPSADLERTAAFAEEFGLGVDLHTDETLDPASHGLADLAARTRHWPAEVIRSAGHCVSLSTQDAATRARTLAAVAEAGVSIVTNPLTNLYLQGWQHPVGTPRGIPPLREILDAGIVLAAGGDNVQDPFNPLGNADMVDVAAELVTAGHLTPAEAWHVSSGGGRAAFGLPPARGRVGEVADVVLVRAAHAAEALAERAPDRIVVRDGRVIAVRRRITRSVLDRPPMSAPSSAPTSEGALI